VSWWASLSVREMLNKISNFVSNKRSGKFEKSVDRSV
jgi:hypothetical protein